MTKCSWPIHLLSLVLFSATAFGQSGNATLNGTVSDATGAVVPGAHVTVTNTATGVSKTVDTTSAGLYVVTALIPGAYNVEIRASGFKTEEVNDVRLVIDEVARVDAHLEVGVATQKLTVIGEGAGLLQATESSVGFVVQSQQVTDLPLNGRYFTQLLQLSPGANAIGFQRNQMPMFNVNGVDNTMIFFRLDGIENNEREFGGANIPVSIDAIQEVKVQTSNFSAEYGRSPIQVDVAVKSGTNQIHGTAFEFLRNNDLDAPVWSYTGPHTTNLLKRNQFGGMFGGPIKKDKLFYLFSYDGTRERFSQPQTLTVPSNDMRNGVFPAGTIIFDPLSQSPFPDNTIPQSRWNSISAKVLPFLPAPNLAGLANINAAGFALAPSNNYYYNPFRNQTINQYTGRVDYNQSEKNTYFGRYTYATNLRLGQGPLATNVQSALNGVESANIGGQNLSGAWNRTISPTTLNELRGGFSTDPQDYAKADNSDYASQFGIKQFLQSNAYPGFPHFIIGSINLGSGDYRPLKVAEKNFQVSDTVSLIRGSHNLRIGGDFRRTILETTNNQLSTGRFTFNGVQTRDRAHPAGTTTCPGGTNSSACGAGDAMADFLLGYLARASDGTPIPDITKYFSNWAGFVNDTWNITKSLTLTIGLRYEYQTRFHTDPPFYTQPVISNGEFTGKVALATGSSGKLPSNISALALGLEPAGTVVSCRSIGLPDNCLVSQKEPAFSPVLFMETTIQKAARLGRW
jgi:Carboxypeptidase regulatory-like domain/TonB-dependent Receptor Plug Domain